MPEVPQDWRSAILQRINEIEAEVRKAQAVHEEILDLTDSLKASLDPNLDEKFEGGSEEYRAIPLDEIDEWGKQRAAAMQVLRNEIDAQALAYAWRPMIPVDSGEALPWEDVSTRPSFKMYSPMRKNYTGI
jgi:hypothetical protein